MDRRVRGLLQAVHTISDLDLDAVLPGLLAAGTALVGARYGALSIDSPDGVGLARFVHTGLDDATVAEMGHLPEGRGLLGRLATDRRPRRIDDLAAEATAVGFPPRHPVMSRFLGVPVTFRGQVLGSLYLTEKAGGGGFTEDDEDVAMALAAVAGTAVSNERLHADAQRLAVFEDRDRIAADLHDQVIQRLFAVGLSLQAAAARLDRPDDVRSRLAAAIAQLDETVLDIRTAVFQLQPATPGESLRRQLFDVVSETAGGTRSSIRTSGLVDTVVVGALAADVLAVTREAVSNAVRHGRASDVVVTVEVKDEVVVQVDDDGMGIDVTAARSGLVGLETRARRRSGSMSVQRRPTGGTSLRWRVPSHSDQG